MLSEETIAKFQTIYKKQFGKELSREEAIEKGIKLLRLVELAYKPISKEDLENLKKRQDRLGW